MANQMDMDEYYYKRRDELSSIRGSSMESFDKTILQLSTGILAITIAFLEKIGKPYSDFTNYLVSVSWIGFLLVVILNLLSFYFARKNMDFKIEDLDDRYKNYEPGAKWPPEKFSCYRKLTEFCNTSALWLFFIAIGLFVIYAVMVQNYSYTQSSQNKSLQEVTVSEENKEKHGQVVEKKDKTGQDIDESIKGGKKDQIIRRGRTESSEPVIKPDKPKK